MHCFCVSGRGGGRYIGRFLEVEKWHPSLNDAPPWFPLATNIGNSRIAFLEWMKPRGISIIWKGVRDFRNKKILVTFMWIFLENKGITPNVCEIFGSKMPLGC